MDNELLRAIQQISEELGKTSVWDIAGVVISGISVILTVVVLMYNHKAIKLTQQSVQQAVNLQLFEKRLELYNAIADDTAFYDTPLSLKIAYNDEIYRLYSDVSELCNKRWVKILEFAQAFHIIGWENQKHGNICHDMYMKYSSQIENEIQNQSTDAPDRYTDDGKVFCLENNLANVDYLHGEICKKYEQLEEKMRTILNQSINL